jgi:RNA polymerase sigma factor (sigma-70 family)
MGIPGVKQQSGQGAAIMPDRPGFNENLPGEGNRGKVPAGISYEEAYHTFYDRVVRQLTYLLGNRAMAEDIAQETFIKLYMVPPPSSRNIGGWLHQVGARLALNYLRGEKRRQQWELRAENPGGDKVIPLEEAIWRQETVRLVREVLGGLPARERVALLLRHTGFTYQEIAGVLKVAPGSVGTLLVRAQRRFLESYRRRNGDDER